MTSQHGVNANPPELVPQMEQLQADDPVSDLGKKDSDGK